MIKFTITQTEPLPENFSGTPQQLLEAILDRLEVNSDLETFHTGPNPPAPNSGPWFKNGVELYGWNGTEYTPVFTPDTSPRQIYAGETAPDFLKYSYWLKYSGNTVEGLYYYGGNTVGWVAATYGVANGSITTNKLALGSVTTEKILDNSILSDNLAGPIAISKWPLGLAGQVLRMNAAGTSPEWKNVYLVSDALDIPDTPYKVTFSHNAGTLPFFVRAVLVCAEAEGGWAVGDEVDVNFVKHTDISYSLRGLLVSVWKTANSVGCRFNYEYPVYLYTKGATASSSLFLLTRTKWKVKFYITWA